MNLGPWGDNVFPHGCLKTLWVLNGEITKLGLELDGDKVHERKWKCTYVVEHSYLCGNGMVAHCNGLDSVYVPSL